MNVKFFAVEAGAIFFFIIGVLGAYVSIETGNTIKGIGAGIMMGLIPMAFAWVKIANRGMYD
jgi:hypothetical protein